MILAYIVFATGFAINIFNQYNINYLYIFECDPTSKMTPYMLLKVSLVIYFISCFCFTCTLLQVKYLHDSESPFYFMFFLFVFLVAYCFQPLIKCGYRTARFQVGYSLFQTFIAPFGSVRFRDFFLADVITSVPPALTDLSVACYFYMSYRTWDMTIEKTIDRESLFLIVCGQIAVFIPFWFRFWQCIHKYVKKNIKPQLYNAGKYFSKLLPPFIILIDVNNKKTNKWNGQDEMNTYFFIWLFFQVFATVYCTCWDYYMDWGLFRSWSSGTFGLRPRIKYPQYFYYFAMFTNLLMRFYWVLAIWHFDFHDDEEFVMNYYEVFPLASLMIEAIRRTQWALIRIENEFFNNFEAYRTIPQIPDLLGLTENINWERVNHMIKEN